MVGVSKAGRKRTRKKRETLRLPADVRQAVSQLANATGWSASKALAFIAQAGWNALNAGGNNLPAMRQVMTAAMAHCETQRVTRKRLAMTAEKLRVARKALDESAHESPDERH
jgi:hypothetical protein